VYLHLQCFDTIDQAASFGVRESICPVKIECRSAVMVISVEQGEDCLRMVWPLICYLKTSGVVVPERTGTPFR